MIRNCLHMVASLPAVALRLRGAVVQTALHHCILIAVVFCVSAISCKKEDAQQPAVPVCLSIAPDMQLGTKSSPVDQLQGRTFGIVSIGETSKEIPIFLHRPARIDASGNVSLLDSNRQPETLFYPVHSTNNYAFCAYYIGESNTYTTVNRYSNDRYGMEVPEYGKVDVLCGLSHAQTLQTASGELVDGFNSSYIRTLQSMGLYDREHLPNIRMQHLCTRINFNFFFDSVETSGWDHVYVTRIGTKDAGTGAYLTFNDQKLNVSGYGSIYYNMALEVGSEGTAASDANFFLAPHTLDNLSFDIYISYSLSVGQILATITNEQLKEVLADNGVESFKPGCYYTFDVHIIRTERAYDLKVSAHK